MNEIELKKRAQRIADRLTALGFTKDGKPMVIDQAYELVAAAEGLRNQHVLRVLAKKATALDAKLSPLPPGVYADGFKPSLRIAPLVIPRTLDDKLIEAMCVAYGPHDDDEIEFSLEQWRLIHEELAKRAGVEPVTYESESAAERVWTQAVNRQGWDRESEILHLEGFLRSAGLMGEFAKYIKGVVDEESGMDAETAYRTSSSTDKNLLLELGYEVKTSDLKRPYWECDDVVSEDFLTVEQAWASAQAHAVSTAMAGAGVESAEGLSPSAKLKLMREFSQLRLQEIMLMLRNCGFRFGKPEGEKARVTWDRANDFMAKGISPSIYHAVGQAWRYACNKAEVTSSLLGATPLDAQLILVEAALTGRVKQEASKADKPAVNKASYRDYSRSLAMLDSTALQAEVLAVDATLDVKHWDDPALLGFLLQAYEKEFCRVAQAAFEDYDFGNDEVEDSGGAEWSTGEDVWRKPVYLRPPVHLSGPGTVDTRKVMFCVTVRFLKVMAMEVIEG